MQCHMHSPLPETFLKPEGCNLLFMARYHCDHVVQMWLLVPPSYYAERTSPTLFYAESTIAGRVVRTNPTNFLWIRHCRLSFFLDGSFFLSLFLQFLLIELCDKEQKKERLFAAFWLRIATFLCKFLFSFSVHADIPP